MASTSSNINFDFDDQENDIWSVYKCIFCNAQLNGNSKILECLHITCNNCILEKKTDSSVQCICQIVTKGQLTVCTIIPQNIKKIQSCNEDNCSKKPKKICVLCKKHYCRKCSKEHLRNNTNHNPNVIIDYTMEMQFPQCTSCKKKCVEVFCTTCSVIVCAFCHLNLHQKHDFIDLEKLITKIKTKLNQTFCELKKNDCFFDFCLDQNKKQIENLKIIKNKLMEEEIDKEMNKLHKKVNERVLELQNLFEKDFLGSLTKINKMERYVIDLKNKNKYYLNLIQALLKHGDTSNIMALSKIVVNKLKLTSMYKFEDKCIFTLKDIQFDFDETFEKCVSAIGAVKTYSWNFASLSNHNLSDFDNVELSNNDFLTENIQSADSKNETNFDGDLEAASLLFTECICCKQRDEILIKCNYCDRHFHSDCHIPALPENVELPKKWKCTMCRDITKYSNKMLSFQKWNTTDDMPVHKYELKIINRILLELYCQNVCDNHIRTFLTKGIYPAFYEKVLQCTSLDYVKTRLESKQYTSLLNFLKDINQIFINAMLYYPSSDPHYLAAFDLQTTFHLLISKWIPKFDLSKLPRI